MALLGAAAALLCVATASATGAAEPVVVTPLPHGGQALSNGIVRVEVTPTPPPATEDAAALPDNAVQFEKLPPYDWTLPPLVGLPGTADIQPSVAACEAKCAGIGDCEAGVWLSGSVRHGECWLSQGLARTPRRDFCGAAAGQTCAGFKRVGPKPAPAPPPAPPSPPRAPLLRISAVGSGGVATEVLRSFHADNGAATTAPLYTQANADAGFRVLLHDHLTSVRPGPGSTPNFTTMLLDTAPSLSNTTALASARLVIGLEAGDDAISFNVSARLRPTPSSSSSPNASARLEYLLASFEWAPSRPPAFVHTPHLKRVSEQHWGHAPSPEYIAADRTFNSPIVSLEGSADGSGVGAAIIADVEQLNAFAVDAPEARPVSGEQNVKWVPNATFNPTQKRYMHPSFPAGIDVSIEPPVGPGSNAVSPCNACSARDQLEGQKLERASIANSALSWAGRIVRHDGLRGGAARLLQAQERRLHGARDPQRPAPLRLPAPAADELGRTEAVPKGGEAGMAIHRRRRAAPWAAAGHAVRVVRPAVLPGGAQRD